MMPQHDCNLRSSETQRGTFFPFLSVLLRNRSGVHRGTWEDGVKRKGL